MRSLLSRGALVGVALLAVAGIWIATPPQHPAPPQRALLAQAVSINSLPSSDANTDRSPEPRAREVMLRLTPTPSAQTAVARMPQKTVRTTVAPAPATPRQAVVGTGQWGLINQDRQAAGLAPLQWNPCLANVASGQAARMAAQGFISHANGRTLDLACHLGPLASESIGFQGGGINDAAMNAWFMGDPPHRANIMGPYHYVGVAWVLASNGTAYLAVEFS